MTCMQLFLITIVVLGVPAHAFEVAGADETFDGAVEPLHLIDHIILPDHESRAGRGATDHRPQFLVTTFPDMKATSICRRTHAYV